jgi:hypothetical protein
MQLLESPTIELTSEGFILALAKEVRHNLTHEEVLVMDLPCPTMWLADKVEEAKVRRRVASTKDCVTNNFLTIHDMI